MQHQRQLSEGDDWQVENQSVALIVSGGFAACSGAMINNTANDGTPYFSHSKSLLGKPELLDVLFQPRECNLLGQHRPYQQQHFRWHLVVGRWRL